MAFTHVTEQVNMQMLTPGFLIIVWHCCLFSDGTPYAGGHFCVKLVLGKSFPAEPPKGFFLTKIFHPNVAKNGEICVNTLKKDWKSDYGVKHILLVCTFATVQFIPHLYMLLSKDWRSGQFEGVKVHVIVIDSHVAKAQWIFELLVG